MGLPSLPFPSSLLKLTAARSDFLHNPRDLQRAALPCWFEPAKRLLRQTGAPNENIVQRQLNMAFLNVFYYLKGTYRHIFIP